MALNLARMNFLFSDAGVKFYCRNCGREGHRRHYCPELKESLIGRKFRCRVCGGMGHNRRTCPETRFSNHKNATQKRNRCRICRQRGHNRRTCPKLIGEKLSSSDAKKCSLTSGSRIYKCRLCQEIGHNIRTCPCRNVSSSKNDSPSEDGNGWMYTLVLWLKIENFL